MGERLLSLKVVDLPQNEWFRAHRCAERFLQDYPERIGQRNGCVYTYPVGEELPIYVYRTRTQIVVRGSREGNGNDPL